MRTKYIAPAFFNDSGSLKKCQKPSSNCGFARQRNSRRVTIIDGSTLCIVLPLRDSKTVQEDGAFEDILPKVPLSTVFNVSYATAYVDLISEFEATCILADDCTTLSSSMMLIMICQTQNVTNVFVVY